MNLPTPMRRMTPWIAVATALILHACATSGDSVEVPTRSSAVTSSHAPGQTLEDFARKSVLKVEEASDRINRSTDVTSMKKRAVQWKINTLATLWDIMNMEDARLATLDLWCTVLQWEEFFSTGAGKEQFGPAQPIAATATREIAEGFDTILSSATSEEIFTKAKAEVEAFALKHPMTSLLRVPYRISESSQLKLSFGWLRDLAMPWQLSSGVVEMADAVDEVAKAADRFSAAVGAFPMTARWQTELLLLEINENRSMLEVLADIDRISRSLESVAATADTLPEDLRQEVGVTLTKVEEMQGGLQTTLTSARGTVEETRKALVELNSGIDRANTTIERIGATTADFERAGEVWKPTFEVFREVINDLDGDPNAPPREGPDTLMKLVRTAEGLHLSAVELKAMFIEFRDLVGSDDLMTGLTEMDQTARGTVDHTTVQMESLVDHATVRIIQIVLVVLCAGLLYRFAAPRLSRRKREEEVRS
jgi:hypothetical protein